MQYQVLCSDLDGTLLSTKSDVSDFTVTQIDRIKSEMQIILVSARMPKAMRHLQKDLGIDHEPIICYNGAYVLHGQQELCSVEIGSSELSQLGQMASPLGIQLGLYHKDEWYVPGDSERVQKEIRYTKCEPALKDTGDTLKDWEDRNIGAHKVMLMGTKESADFIYLQLQELFGTKLNVYRSNDTLIELAPRSVSKRSAIELLLNKEQSMKDVLAFGDNYNDMEMLKVAGCGVAVGNAREEVKAVADHIAKQNSEDGVAHFIKAHLI